MSKRDLLLGLLQNAGRWTYVPAAFFMHFDRSCHRGAAAINRHLEFFRYTGMDFIKVQYENAFPHHPEIQRPTDWSRMPKYTLEFFEDQLDVVRGLVKAARDNALVIVTVYSPFMHAAQTVQQHLLVQHINEKPDAVKKGMEIITESLLGFVKACVKLGVDGFYTSTQGGEGNRFCEPEHFAECIEPYDLAVMTEVNDSCPFNILHICNYEEKYEDMSPFLKYPGQVVSCGLDLKRHKLTSREISEKFGRPFLGGMDRHGVISKGWYWNIRRKAKKVLAEAPDRFILGADCTLHPNVSWERIRTAIDVAHRFRQ